MKPFFIVLLFTFISLETFCQRTIVFISPTNYEGVLTDVTNSARAEALGKNTITLDGLRTAFENPATIAPGKDKVQVAMNFTKGHSYFPKSYYPFAGLSYRINNKISIGFTTHQWIDPDSYWNAEIAGREFETTKKAQRVYSLLAAGEIKKDLYIGVSGNMLREMEIKGKTTAKDFVINTGVIYDKALKLINSKGISNEKIRLAASLYNLLFDGETTQRANDSISQLRDMPAILRLGVAHSFSVPIKTNLFRSSKRLKALSQTIEFSTRIQYTDYLKARKNFGKEYKYQTMIGIGVEATALHLLSARLGYFTETRPPAKNTTDLFATKTKRKGFTWGLGCMIPASQWSDGKLPFDFKFDIYANRFPDLLDEGVAQRLSNDFTDKKMMLSLGLEFSIK